MLNKITGCRIVYLQMTTTNTTTSLFNSSPGKFGLKKTVIEEDKQLCNKQKEVLFCQWIVVSSLVFKSIAGTVETITLRRPRPALCSRHQENM